MSQNLSSAAVMICALRVNLYFYVMWYWKIWQNQIKRRRAILLGINELMCFFSNPNALRVHKRTVSLKRFFKVFATIVY